MGTYGTPQLEVIACTVADAVAAQKGGASRLEIVRNLEQGGLTPSFELVREIRETVDLPLRVMVRESVGFETCDEDEIHTLCEAARKFAMLRVDGLVLGYLKDGSVDLALCERILNCAPNLNATFHHAFEDANDQIQALMEIKRLAQVDRILSSGSSDSLARKVEQFELYQRLASPEIGIIAGGGIDLKAIEILISVTKIREFHVGRAARLDNQADGEVMTELVSELVRKVKSIK